MKTIDTEAPSVRTNRLCFPFPFFLVQELQSNDFTRELSTIKAKAKLLRDTWSQFLRSSSGLVWSGVQSSGVHLGMKVQTVEGQELTLTLTPPLGDPSVYLCVLHNANAKRETNFTTCLTAVCRCCLRVFLSYWLRLRIWLWLSFPFPFPFPFLIRSRRSLPHRLEALSLRKIAASFILHPASYYHCPRPWLAASLASHYYLRGVKCKQDVCAGHKDGIFRLFLLFSIQAGENGQRWWVAPGYRRPLLMALAVVYLPSFCIFFFAERVTGSEQTGGVDPSPFSSGADPPSTTPATNLSGGVRPKPPRCADSGEHFSLQRQFPSHR